MKDDGIFFVWLGWDRERNVVILDYDMCLWDIRKIFFWKMVVFVFGYWNVIYLFVVGNLVFCMGIWVGYCDLDDYSNSDCFDGFNWCGKFLCLGVLWLNWIWRLFEYVIGLMWLMCRRGCSCIGMV